MIAEAAHVKTPSRVCDRVQAIKHLLSYIRRLFFRTNVEDREPQGIAVVLAHVRSRRTVWRQR
jgi:hypothetical protein